MGNAARDSNRVTTLLGVSSSDGITPVTLYADPTTHRLLTSASGGAAPADATYVVLSANATLTDERILTGTANQITITDNGAGSTVVLSLPQSIATSSTPTFASMSLTGASSLTLGTASTNAGAVILKNATNANTATIVSGVTAASYSVTWPTGQGAASTVLTNDGAGVLSWTPNGTGDVVGPASATDGVPALFDGATGKLLKNSTPTGTGNPVLQTSPTLTTPVLGVATATSINGLTITSSTGTLTITNAKTLSATNTLTLSGTDGTTMTFPTTTATIARTDAGQTFTGVQVMTTPTITTSLTTGSSSFDLLNATATTVNFAGAATTMAIGASTALVTVAGNIISTSNAIAASGNAATVPITRRISTVTNNSAATLTITITTTSAVDGQMVLVRVLDASAAAQTITWVNTENSTVTAPTTSNGSTTLPLTVGFMFNNATSKWRAVAVA